MEEWSDRIAKEAKSTRTEGARSIWVIVIREGRGVAALSFKASMMLMLSESSDSLV